MSELSEKLKSLGVRLGATGLSPIQKPQKLNKLEELLNGRFIENDLGTIFVIQNQYPADQLIYKKPENIQPALDILAAWSGNAEIAKTVDEHFIFVDTETTGLAGGTGTLTFLIGIGFWQDQSFHLSQIFLQDPENEPAQLFEFEKLLAQRTTIVTYNGKSFDVPLLNTRFLTHGWQSPLISLPHIDLLILARKLWKDRLPSRSLGNIEAHILGINRDKDDIPGWMIPQIYFDFLRFGETSQLTNVVYHNAMDVLSLAVLLRLLFIIFNDPFNPGLCDPQDIINLAKLYEEIGLNNNATSLYRMGLMNNISKPTYIDALTRLAKIYKKSGLFNEAIPLWENAASHNHLPAYVELAKYYEHRARDYQTAALWTKEAIAILESQSQNTYVQQRWKIDLEYRLNRLDKIRYMSDHIH